MHRLLLFYVPFVMVNLALDFYVLWHGRLAFLTLEDGLWSLARVDIPESTAFGLVGLGTATGAF